MALELVRGCLDDGDDGSFGGRVVGWGEKGGGGVLMREIWFLKGEERERTCTRT